MIIGIAGPYSAETAEKRQSNLDAINAMAAAVLDKGHIPVVGINAALPVIAISNVTDPKKSIMDISLAVISACDALLLFAESPGANQERNLILSLGRPVYFTLAEIPEIR